MTCCSSCGGNIDGKPQYSRVLMFSDYTGKPRKQFFTRSEPLCSVCGAAAIDAVKRARACGCESGSAQ